MSYPDEKGYETVYGSKERFGGDFCSSGVASRGHDSYGPIWAWKLYSGFMRSYFLASRMKILQI